MKWLKRIGLVLLILALVILLATYFFMQSTLPDYSGTLKLNGVEEEVTVYFDDYGIPHIYAQNERDAQFALGYVHAQERLFQMEMIRRLASGRLSEVLGKDLLEIDKHFRVLSLKETAALSVQTFFQTKDKAWQQAALAYIDGINAYVENGKTPLEFSILGIPKTKFSIEDCYLTVGYMAYGFSGGFFTDALLDTIYRQLGSEYINDWDVMKEVPKRDRSKKDKQAFFQKHKERKWTENNYSSIRDLIPVPALVGSNSWVLGPDKTNSGKVILCNDTHIGFGQPAVWFEAHIEYPGHRFYGNYLAAFPFGVAGHNDKITWGLTMLENDDVDFYKEKVNPENPNQVWYKNQWEDLKIRKDTIKVKGEADLIYDIKKSRHGPLANNTIPYLHNNDTTAYAIWWIFHQFPCNLIEGTYRFNHAQNMPEIKEAVARLTAPGLNIMYGDVEGNIAWWAAGKLLKRPAHVHSKLILDGASGKDEPLGYYDFSENPHAENPPEGYVCSANNMPDTSGGVLHPGYYLPNDRMIRIQKILSQKNNWTVQDMQTMINESKAEVSPGLAKEMYDLIKDRFYTVKPENQLAQETLDVLKKWEGDHQLNDIAPVIYYKLLYYIMFYAMQDELGTQQFTNLKRSYLFWRTYQKIIPNEQSVWWDDVTTATEKERRKDIFIKAFEQTLNDLHKQFGQDIKQWKWGKAHTLEHVHAIGMKKPFNYLFNVGPFPINGGNDVINNQGFLLNQNGLYETAFGPAKRRIVDFADIENTYNVLPTGQSGNVMSKHYDDQAPLYNAGRFRPQLMNKEAIVNIAQDRKIIFMPK